MPPQHDRRRHTILLIPLLFAASLAAQVSPSAILLPTGITIDTTGNIYFADANRHQIFEATIGGQLFVVAGSGTQGYAGDNGTAISAQLNSPQALAFANGTLYIADTGNNVIRAIMQGTITTLAGTGKAAFFGDNGPAISAAIAAPNALAIDATGALFIADSANHRIRRISSQGTITTIAGNGAQGFSGDNALATSAQLDTPSGLAVAASGVIYIADTHNHRIRAINQQGIITTIAGTGTSGFSGDNALATGAQLDLPRGLATTASGAILIADANNQRVRSISQRGIITTLAGSATQGAAADGTPAQTASLNAPRALATTSLGYPIIADAASHTLRILAADGNLYVPAAFAPTRTSTVTLTASTTAATITITGSIGTPQGTAQLIVDGIQSTTATLSAGSASISLATLTPGTHTISATYAGDVLNPAAISPAITVSTGKADTATITQPPAPEDYAGLPLLLNAHVTSTSSGLPTGTVTFTEGATTLATAQLAAGIASGVYVAPTAGTHSIVANYAGDTSFSPSIAPAVTAIIRPMPDFTIATSGSTTQTVAAGAIATYTLAITPQNGPFTGAVSMSVTGLPFGATATFAPPQVVPGAASASTTLSIQTLAKLVRRTTPNITFYALLLLPLLLARRRHRRVIAATLCIITLTACGTRINQPPIPDAGSYTLTISATGTNLAGALIVHTTIVTLTIE